MIMLRKLKIEKKIIGLAFLLSLVYVLPMVVFFRGYGIQDWDYHLQMLGAARKSVLDYKQFPLWNPYHCGGLPLFGNPESAVASITFLMVLLLGVFRGVMGSIILHYVIGFLGFYLLVSKYTASKQAKLMGTIVFTFGSVLSSALAVGMLPFITAMYMPWVLSFFLDSVKDGKVIWGKSALAGLCLAMSFYHGYHVVLFFLPIYAVFMLVTWWMKKDVGYVMSWFVSLGVFLMLALPKLALSIILIVEYPRQIVSDYSGYNWLGLIRLLTSHGQYLNVDISNMVYYWEIDESSIYIGIFSLVVGVIGFLARGVGIRFVLLFILLLMIRFKGGFGGWDYLRMLPIYSMARVAQRFRYVFVLFLSILVARGWGFLERFITKPRIGWLAVFLVFVDLWFVGALSQLGMAFYHKPIKINMEKGNDEKFVNYRGGLLTNGQELPIYAAWSYDLVGVEEDFGVLNCNDTIPISVRARGFSEEDYFGEAGVVGGGGVGYEYWSPNLLKLVVDDKAKTLVINQNYDPAWVAKNNGREVVISDYNGLLGITGLTRGEVVLKYAPYKFVFRNFWQRFFL